MHHILCIKILCDDKVKSPITLLLHTVLQMCTVESWGVLFLPVTANPERWLDATIAAVVSKLHPV